MHAAHQHADALVGEIGAITHLPGGSCRRLPAITDCLYQHDLRVGEIRLREADLLFAFCRCRHTGDDDVHPPGLQGRDQRHELHVGELNGPLQACADDARQLAVVAGDTAFLIDEIERFARGADADAKQFAGLRYGDIRFLVGAGGGFEPALLHVVQRAVLLQFRYQCVEPGLQGSVFLA